MPVTVDHQPLDTAALDLPTIGDVLTHLREKGRIAVELTVDGKSPSNIEMETIRAQPAGEHDVAIATADPREMALDALSAMEQALQQTDDLRQTAADLLQRNEIQPAMQSLGICLTTWQQAQQCVTQSAALTGIDLNALSVDGQPMLELITCFSGQLREIRTALENQDYVSLSDILTYELSETGPAWRNAIAALSTDIVARGGQS